ESLLPVKPPHRSKNGFKAYETANGADGPLFAGATEDFSHLRYMVNDALTPEAEGEEEEFNNLYDYTEGGLKLVNILPNGKTEPNAVFGGQIIKGDYRGEDFPDFNHALSEDGSRIFWTGEGA